MCGRFTITMHASEIEALIEKEFKVNPVEVEDQPRYNIAPTQNVMGLLYHRNTFRFGSLKWGLKFTHHLAINTRIETIFEKPYFQDLMNTQKIVLLSNGYFEWDMHTKEPYFIHYENQEPMFLGGLWRKNNEDFECSIITLEAPNHLNELHPRVPFSMTSTQAKTWLQNDLEPSQLIKYPDQATKISRLVNRVSENHADILKP